MGAPLDHLLACSPLSSARPESPCGLLRHTIVGDMQLRKYCEPKDMIRFLLAFCCQDDSSTIPVSHDDALDECLEECSEKVAQVVDLEEMLQKLDA